MSMLYNDNRLCGDDPAGHCRYFDHLYPKRLVLNNVHDNELEPPEPGTLLLNPYPGPVFLRDVTTVIIVPFTWRNPQYTHPIDLNFVKEFRRVYVKPIDHIVVIFGTYHGSRWPDWVMDEIEDEQGVAPEGHDAPAALAQDLVRILDMAHSPNCRKFAFVNAANIDPAFLGQPQDTTGPAMQNLIRAKVASTLPDSVMIADNVAEPGSKSRYEKLRTKASFLENVEWLGMEEFMFEQTELAHDALGVRAWNTWRQARIVWAAEELERLAGRSDDADDKLRAQVWKEELSFPEDEMLRE